MKAFLVLALAATPLQTFAAPQSVAPSTPQTAPAKLPIVKGEAPRTDMYVVAVVDEMIEGDNDYIVRFNGTAAYLPTATLNSDLSVKLRDSMTDHKAVRIHVSADRVIVDVQAI